MTSATEAVEYLRQELLAQVETHTQVLASTGGVNLSGFDQKVKAYCDAVAALPKEEAKQHTPHLEALMQHINGLSKQLVVARDSVKQELEALSRIKQAHSAYHKSEAMSGPRPKQKPEEE